MPQNYAGDLSLPAASHVIRTIFSIFPTCRIFREELPVNSTGPATTSPATTPNTSPPMPEDFTNMVIFCKHPSSSSPDTSITFRRPTRADLLDSSIRLQYLFPRPEMEIPKEVFEWQEGPVLRRGATAQLERWHRVSAMLHWRIMRKVVSAAVWENW
jgi:hypothetical protein